MPVTNPTPYVVFLSPTLLAADWVDSLDLICVDLVRGIAPTIDTANLVFEFGIIDGAYVPPADYLGKFVRILAPALSLDWVGVIVSEEMDRGPIDETPTEEKVLHGTQRFQAVGPEWFLARETINHAYIADPPQEIDRMPGFNMGFGAGRDGPYASTPNRSLFGLGFAAQANLNFTWGALDIVRYLLDRHQPFDHVGGRKPCDYILSEAAEEFLVELEPIVPAHGLSVWSVLQTVIDPRRGLHWWTEYDHALEACVIHVSSGAVDPVDFPSGATLPAALTQVTLPAQSDVQRRVRVRHRRDKQYDRVIVRGAPRRAVMTVGFHNETLEPGWEGAEEDDYKSAAAGSAAENDRFRQATRFERVYQVFNLPHEWDGQLGGGVFACPAFTQGSGSILGAEKMNVPSLRFVNQMPLCCGWDYSNPASPLFVNDPLGAAPEFQRPFAFVDIGSEQWRFAHEINVSSETDNKTRRTSYHLRMLSGFPGLQLSPSGGMPHALALNHFDPEEDAPTEHPPEVDYETLRCTVCAEFDAWCEGYFPVAKPAASPVSQLYIYLQNPERARFDWMAAGTVFDIQDGVLKTSSGGALRDDRMLCADLARLAYQWYGVPRAELAVESAFCEVIANVGDLIRRIEPVGTDAEVIVNAVVSQVTYRLEAGGTLLLAGLPELDFSVM